MKPHNPLRNPGHSILHNFRPAIPDHLATWGKQIVKTGIALEVLQVSMMPTNHIHCSRNQIFFFCRPIISLTEQRLSDVDKRSHSVSIFLVISLHGFRNWTEWMLFGCQLRSVPIAQCEKLVKSNYVQGTCISFTLLHYNQEPNIVLFTSLYTVF